MRLAYGFVFFFLFSFQLFAQVSGVVIDHVSGNPIPFVNIWMQNTNTGTTSDKNGYFSLKSKDKDIWLVFSAVGYRTEIIPVRKIIDQVALTPQSIQLQEVVLKTPNNKNSLEIGAFKKSKIDFYYANGDRPWIIARFVKYEDRFAQTPYLKTVRLVTVSKVPNAVFNLRFYRMGNNGTPGDYLYTKNVLFYAKKGKHITEVDVSGLHLKVPEKGFFVSVEGLVIEQNRYKFTYTMEGSHKKREEWLYAPKFGAIPTEDNNIGWMYLGGKWRKIQKQPESILKKYRNKYAVLAAQLVLTN